MHDRIAGSTCRKYALIVEIGKLGHHFSLALTNFANRSMAQIAAYLLMILAMAERRDCPIAEWEVRGRRALVCLLFSTRVFDLRESPDFTRLLNDPKCLRSSSKSSSKTDCLLGDLFQDRGASISSPRPPDGRKKRGKLAQSSLPHSTAFSGPALSNGASLVLRRKRIGEGPNAIKAHS